MQDEDEVLDQITENEIYWRAILEQQNISQNFHLLRPLNPLSAPQKVTCDICQNPATLSCISCHACWCSHEHFLLDDEPVHSHICSKLTELWFLSYEGYREGNIERVLANKTSLRLEQDLLLEIRTICAQRAAGYLSDRNYIMAVAPSLRAVSLTCKVFGKRSVESAQAEIMLAKCHLGLRKYGHVNKQLSFLNVEISALIEDELKRLGEYDDVKKISHISWVVSSFGDVLIEFPFFKIPVRVVKQMSSVVIELQAQLFVICGMRDQSFGEQDQAMHFLSKACYFFSLACGPTGLKTTLAYLELGKTLLIGQTPVILNDTPDARFASQTVYVKNALLIVDYCVAVWATVIRRYLNDNKRLDYELAELGEARLLLQDAKAIASIYVGTTSSSYCAASVTLALLFLMYDKEYEAVIEARSALQALYQYFEWNKALATEEHLKMMDYLYDIRDVISIMETPEIIKRIAAIDREARTKV